MLRTITPAILCLAAVCSWVAPAAACPFCSGVSLTLSEEMKTATAAVVGKLVKLPPPPADNATLSAVDSKAVFEIVNVLKGEELLKNNGGAVVGSKIDVIYFGQDEPGKLFFLMGSDSPNVSWNTPIPLTDRSAAYVAQLPGLAESGADRLAFFQQHFEDSEELLARDAYDEFAKAPYSEVKDLKDRMQHDKLTAFIKDPNVSPSRRRLYLTMLGVCGNEGDLPMLEAMITSEDREQKSALDATIACYLTLHGPDGLPLIEEQFLKKADAEYTDTYAAIMALRFHGQEESRIPRERLVAALRHMLDRPQLADLVIPDLARWEDWSAMDRLVQLFKEADEQSSWVRVPVIKYLKECPLPEAKLHIEELAKIDPKVVQQANSFFPLVGAPAPPAQSADAAAAAAASADEPSPAGAPADEAATASSDSATPAADATASSEPAVSEADLEPAADAPTAPISTAGPTAAAETPANKEGEAAADEGTSGVAAVTPPAVGPEGVEPSQPAGAIKSESTEAARAPLEIRENPWMTTFWVLAIPLAVGVLLMLLLLVILRGQRPTPTTYRTIGAD